MDFQYIILGMLLLVGMSAGMINLYIKKRKEKQNLSLDQDSDHPEY